MFKNVLSSAILCILFSLKGFSQISGIPRASKAHDKMIELVEISQSAIFPDSAISQLKSFAKVKGYSESAVLKNIMYLKPLYNVNLSKEDKLFAANYLLNDSKLTNATYPTLLVENVIKTIK